MNAAMVEAKGEQNKCGAQREEKADSNLGEI